MRKVFLSVWFAFRSLWRLDSVETVNCKEVTDEGGEMSYEDWKRATRDDGGES